jgi:hypothetical protein
MNSQTEKNASEIENKFFENINHNSSNYKKQYYKNNDKKNLKIPYNERNKTNDKLIAPEIGTPFSDEKNIFTGIYLCIYIFMYMYLYIYVYMYMNVHIFICIHMSICVYTYKQVK